MSIEVLDKKSDLELYRSILAEVAKAGNEIRCAKQDIAKAESRVSFTIMVVNALIERKGD